MKPCDITFEENTHQNLPLFVALYNGNPIAFVTVGSDSINAQGKTVYRAFTKDGTLVHSASPKGDGLFEGDERDFYLRKAKEAITDFYNEKENSERFSAFYSNITNHETL